MREVEDCSPVIVDIHRDAIVPGQKIAGYTIGLAIIDAEK